jgi:alanine racemase
MKLDASFPPYITKILEIDLEAIAHNYGVLKTYLAPRTRCGAVLKANAYGLGQDPIMTRLAQAGCRDFFFAFVDEAVQARTVLPDPAINIYVLNGVLENCPAIFTDYNLIPCLISVEHLRRWVDHAKTLAKQLPCLIHLDTGMGREGLSFAEFQTLMTDQQDLLSSLDVRYLMSHMADSNYPPSPKNNLQLERFKTALALAPNLKGSFANSSAMFLGRTFQFDLARPGMALYGYKDSHLENLTFKPALTTKARVLLTRTLPKGESIGYDSTFTTARETHIALVCVGHNDGILRTASNKGSLTINGLKAPIIGRISMDMMMVDITDHPQGSITSATWAELYGDYASTVAFAESEGTSVYELLVRHGKRYHRSYK